MYLCIIKSPVGIVHACGVECYELEAFQSSQEPHDMLGFTKICQDTSRNMKSIICQEFVSKSGKLYTRSRRFLTVTEILVMLGVR